MSMLTVLAIGYVCLAFGHILPKFIKDEDQGKLAAFFLALISMVFFLNVVIRSWFY